MCQTAGLLFSAATESRSAPKKKRITMPGQRNFLIDEFRLSASNALNTP